MISFSHINHTRFPGWTAIFFMVCILTAQPVSAASAYRVVQILDGNTIRVESSRSRLKVRLMGIHVPALRSGENQRPRNMGMEARDYLAGMVLGQKVELRLYGYDVHTRVLAEVYRNGININLEMVKAGMATVSKGMRPPNFDLASFRTAETEARQKKLGIWGGEIQPVPAIPTTPKVPASAVKAHTEVRKQDPVGTQAVESQKKTPVEKPVPGIQKQTPTPPTEILAPAPVVKVDTEVRKQTAAKTPPTEGQKEVPEKKPVDHIQKETPAPQIKTQIPAPDKSPVAENQKASAIPEPDLAPAPDTGPKISVTGIRADIDGDREVVIVVLNGFSIPTVFDIDGKNPRIVIDIWNVGSWSGKNRIPVEGRLIKRIRTYLHKDTGKFRIVLDLNIEPSKQYTISQFYDIAKSTYRLQIQ
jgi:endonuclease YncB( thermonuclease family)